MNLILVGALSIGVFSQHAALIGNPDDNFVLKCERKILDLSPPVTKTRNLKNALVIKVRFTGRERIRTDPKSGEEVRYENFIVEIDGLLIEGGRVAGSTFDSSTTYDGDFAKSGEGSMGWAFSRDLQAFTLRIRDDLFLCELE